jgi:uncharacterized membrane protein YdjX (TVP38/TMEM64 family)
MKNSKNYLWAALGLAFSFCLVAILAKNIKVAEDVIGKAGIAGPLISIGLYSLLSATPIPTDPLTVINGALFGPVAGIMISWMGNNIAAMIEYFIGRSIGKATDFHKHKEKLPFGLGKWPVDSPLFLFLGRFVPQFGGKVVSLMGGIYNVPLWRYVWTAALANLIGSILLALGGWGLLNLI